MKKGQLLSCLYMCMRIPGDTDYYCGNVNI